MERLTRPVSLGDLECVSVKQTRVVEGRVELGEVCEQERRQTGVRKLVLQPWGPKC